MGSLRVTFGGSQSSLLQSVHRIWPRSGKKPEPTSETEQREHLKHGWCHCRSSKEMYFPSPKPAETQDGGVGVREEEEGGQPVRKTLCQVVPTLGVLRIDLLQQCWRTISTKISSCQQTASAVQPRGRSIELESLLNRLHRSVQTRVALSQRKFTPDFCIGCEIFARLDLFP